MTTLCVIQQYRIRGELSCLPGQIARAKESHAKDSADIAIRHKTAEDDFTTTVGNKVFAGITPHKRARVQRSTLPPSRCLGRRPSAFLVITLPSNNPAWRVGGVLENGSCFAIKGLPTAPWVVRMRSRQINLLVGKRARATSKLARQPQRSTWLVLSPIRKNC